MCWSQHDNNLTQWMKRSWNLLDLSPVSIGWSALSKRAIKKKLDDDWMNFLSHLNVTNQMFYSQMNEVATAQSFLMVHGATLDLHP